MFWISHITHQMFWDARLTSQVSQKTHIDESKASIGFSNSLAAAHAGGGSHCVTDDANGEFAKKRRIKGSEMQGPLNMPSGGNAAIVASGCS